MEEPVVISWILGGKNSPVLGQYFQCAEQVFPLLGRLPVLLLPTYWASGWADAQPSVLTLHTRYLVACPLERELFEGRSMPDASVSPP